MTTAKTMSSVAAAVIVGLIISRMPLNICLGKVRCSGPARKSDDHDLIEGGDEGEQRAGDYARQDERQDDLEEHPDGGRRPGWRRRGSSV